jgi:hypothetical protein
LPLNREPGPTFSASRGDTRAVLHSVITKDYFIDRRWKESIRHALSDD